MPPFIALNRTLQLTPQFSTYNNTDESLSKIVGFNVVKTGLKLINAPNTVWWDKNNKTEDSPSPAELLIAKELLPKLQAVTNLPAGGGAQAIVWEANKKTIAESLLKHFPNWQLQSWVWSGGDFSDGKTVTYKMGKD